MFEFKEIELNIDFKMKARVWRPLGAGHVLAPFLLIHGLASNARTWDKVGELLAKNGAHVVAIDQRNHGQSEPTEDGFDFGTITSDVNRVLELLGWEVPILVGQSWGGNVLTEFGARYPGRARALVMVDGGFLDLRSWGESWEDVYKQLMPPDVGSFTADMMRSMIQLGHPDWDEAGVEATLANLRILENGYLERRLSVDKHMQIVRHMFDQNMDELYSKVREPVLICAAGADAEPDERKKTSLENARKMEKATIKWFGNTDHDIHVQKPVELCKTMINWIDEYQKGLEA